MEVITIESKAFQEILNQLNQIQSKIEWNEKDKPFNDTWLNNEEVCKLLKVSKRTLQKYRDEGLLGFSQTGSKIYYKASDVETYLKANYNPTF